MREVNLNTLIKEMLSNIKKYKFVFLFTIIFCLAFSFYLFNKKETIYKYSSTVVFDKELLNDEAIASFFQSINTEIKEQNFDRVSKLLTVNPKSAETIIGLGAEVKSTVKDTSRQHNLASFIIYLNTTSENIEDIEKGLLYTLNSNNTINERATQNINTLKSYLKEIDTDLENLNIRLNSANENNYLKLIQVKSKLNKEKIKIEREINSLRIGFSYLDRMNSDSPIFEKPNLTIYLVIGFLVGISICFFMLNFIQIFQISKQD